MPWKHRKGGAWNAPTIKQRKNGQWVTIGGGGTGGDGGGGGGGTIDTTPFYTDGPPTRSGTTYTYDGTNYSSISAALTTLNSGDSLYIDPSNSPYTEHISIPSNNNVANGITMFSDWDITFNDTGQPTVNTTGAVIDQPGDESGCMRVDYGIRSPNSSNTSIDLVGTYTGSLAGGNETSIDVTDSSPFSVGDQIYIQEDTRPWGIPSSGGAAGAGETFQFATVTGISGNTLALDQPLYMSYPNKNATAVGKAKWTMKDFHVHGLKFKSNGGTTVGTTKDYGVVLGNVYNSWFNDILVENAKTHMIFHMLSMFNRFDNISFRNGDHYGLNSQAGTTRTMATRMMGDSHNRYTVRFGPSGQSTPKGYARDIAARSLLRTAGGVHSGGFGIDYENVTANNTRIIVTRSYYITVDGFTVKSGNTQGPPLTAAQLPAYITVKNGHVGGMEGTGSTVWGFRLRGSSAPKGPEKLHDVTYENITIDPYENRSKADLGYFETESDSPTSGPLTFRNVTYGGNKLTLSDVKSWSGYDSSVLPDITVE